MKFNFSIEEAITELKKLTSSSVLMMQHGTMQLKYYAPEVIDTQTPHQQDELYIVASGHAIFYLNGERTNCKEGDVLFAPATIEHRFETFTKDFATWVIFYGKDGGEKD